MAEERITSITLTEMEAAFLHVCGQIPDREVGTPLNKSEAKQRLADFCKVLKSRCQDADFLAPEIAAVSDLVLALLNCDAIKVADLLEVIDGLADYAEKPLEEQTEGSIVLYLVTPGSMGHKLLTHASLVADTRKSEAETETKVEALNIATRDFSGPCCTKTLDEAVKILNGINDLQKDGKRNKKNTEIQGHFVRSGEPAVEEVRGPGRRPRQ